jgi:maleylpyruvate isomerase
MTKPEARLDQVYAATALYLQDVDRLTADDLVADTVLPGWSRAHVVAHVALHALGTSRALNGAAHGHPLPIYDSPEQRDTDIATTASIPVDELRELSFDACGRFKAACSAIHESDATWDSLVERTPRGQVFTLEGVIDARWREVEIHHVDLGVGYSPAEWSPAFATYIFDEVTWDRGASADLTVRTPEGDTELGSGGGPVVEGNAAGVAYWLLGRDSGHGLAGDLPTLGPWIRRTRAR